MHGRGWMAFMWAVIGAIVGHLVGRASDIPFLKAAPEKLGLGPATLDLSVVQLTLGFSVTLSVGGAVGLVIALWLALRQR